MRLSENNLSRLPASIARPTYDRSKVVGSIVHLGIGAFHRAHQAMFTDAVLASGDLAWGIVGAGVISADMKNALLPQDCLYALAEMSADSEKVKVIGSIVDVLGGVEDADKLLARMSDIGTRIVSITVTEKGYYLDLATGKLQLQAPAIAADLASPQTPKTILGLIVQALKQRKAAGIPPFTVLSCDNLPNNGKLAKAAVLAFAREVDSALATWIEANVCFPCTMVDRITPATTDADRAYVTVESLKQRFRNPALKHRTAQIASDGSQKLPQRLLAPLRDRIAKCLPSPMIATAVAA